MFVFLTIMYCYHQVGRSEGLPNEVIPDYESNEEFLKKVHHVLLEVCTLRNRSQERHSSLMCDSLFTNK